MLGAFKQRRPWTAVVIALLFSPIAGMLFVNRGKTSLYYLAAYIALIFLVLWLLPANPTSNGPPVWVQLVEGSVSVAGSIHAYFLAKKRDPEEPRHWYSRRWYIAPLMPLIFVAALFFLRAFFYQTFDIPSSSMVPTAGPGDYIIVEKYAYRFSPPRRGDVVVFYARSFRSYFIKRIVALPGDHIQLKEGRIFLNGTQVPTHQIADFMGVCYSDGDCRTRQYEESYPGGGVARVIDKMTNGPDDTTDVFVVPENAYFVLGDNRDNSADSRNTLGYVARNEITGRAVRKFITAHHWVWQPIN